MRIENDPTSESIDGLIDWIRNARDRDAEASLFQLLRERLIDLRSLGTQRLVDLACIDLIHRKRLGQSVTVESYVADFPQLGTDTHRLDLIDAELCVAEEIGLEICTEGLAKRFPDLADQIGELVQLGSEAELMPAAMFTDQSHKSLSHHGFDRAGDQIRFDPHVDES